MRRRIIRPLGASESQQEQLSQGCERASLGGRAGGARVTDDETGGEQCVRCGGRMGPEDVEHGPCEIVVWNRCASCGLTLRRVYQLVDAF